jgi:uncharacterized protein (DUF1499 family)
MDREAVGTHHGPPKLAALARALALLVALAALVMLALSGPGVRFDLFGYRTGLTMFRWSGHVGIAALILAAITLLWPRARARGVLLPIVALLIGALAWSAPFQLQRQASGVPPINDITTDTANPPAYMTAKVGYPGEQFAKQQRTAYPDLQPITLALSPKEAFDRAVQAAEAMGWEVVGRDAKAGTIEAVDTTKWFGFKDDIAIRVRADGAGSRIDIRSKSRVGRSDLGTNARRIRAYAERLK